MVGVGSEVAQCRAACGLGRCVGVSCFRLGRLQMLVAQARGEWCALGGWWVWMGWVSVRRLCEGGAVGGCLGCAQPRG